METIAKIEAPTGRARLGSSVGARMLAGAWQMFEFRIGLAVIATLVLCSVFAPLLTGISATSIDVSSRFAPPLPLDGSSFEHLLGTDQLGRDLLIRSLTGLRNALFIGVTSVIGMFVIGSIIGMIAGYFGGWISMILMRLTDAQMAIPVIILAITILGMMRPTPLLVILVLVLAGWPIYARTVRSAMLSERRKEYVRGARILGASHLRIILLHIAPNILPPVAFVAVLDVARMMIFEAVFGFIGIGVQPPTPTFGTIIADGMKYLLNAWWITTIPGLLLAISLCAINLMGGSLERARNRILQGI